MDDNRLDPHNPRLGWYLDGDKETPEVAAMLVNTGERIELTLPLKGLGDGDEHYSRWFTRGLYIDDVDRTKYSYRPPSVAQFVDHAGRVVLLGCRFGGANTSLHAGTGRIVADAAVLGARNLRYEKVNGMRSEIPGLSRWSGVWSVSSENETDSAGRVQKVTVTLSAGDDIRLARGLNLTLRPAWATSRSADGRTYVSEDRVELETMTKDARPQMEHLRLHESMRELVVLSSWQSFGYKRLAVNRHDDAEPTPAPGGEPRWAEVVTYRVRRHESAEPSPKFLFRFDDIGTRGVHRWVHVRRHFERAIQPMVVVAEKNNRFLETNMLQMGTALEALGYQLAIDEGGSRLNNRRQLSFPDALQTVLDHLPCTVLDDPKGWKDRVNAAYKGVKHADNPAPVALDLANAMREAILVLRVWLAGRLGCPAAVISDRLTTDPLRAEYRLAD